MRKFAQEMVNYANNEDALAFVRLGEVNGTHFYIYVEYPLWRDSEHYVVRNDMTVAEAIEDRENTIQAFEEAQEAMEALVELEATEQDVLEMLDDAREELLARLP